MNSRKKILAALAVFSALGMIVAGQLTYQHYQPIGGKFCDINDFINCDIVNKSEYAEIFGMPVAILGFLAYLYFFLVSIGLMKGWKLPKWTVPFTALAALGSMIFALGLTYIEFFVLRSICILCVTQQIFIIIIFILSTKLWLKDRRLSLRNL